MQHVPYRKHFYCSKNPTQLIKSVLRKNGSSYTAKEVAKELKHHLPRLP